jgi:CHAD domain-containing protein
MSRTESPSARDVVVAHITQQVEALRGWEDRARANEPDAVHQMRVNSRRLSAALSTFGPLWEGDGLSHLRSELAWLGALLGEARDIEVMQARLHLVAAGDADAQPGIASVDQHLGTRHREALAAVDTTLGSDRYRACLALLDSLLVRDEWSAEADRPADRVLASLVRRDWRRVRRRASRARRSHGAARDHHLHAVRRAARRLRYAAEAVVPVYGQDAELTARAAKAVQDVLGEHQDSVVSSELVGALAAADPSEGHAVAYARLLAAESRHRLQTETLFEESWTALRDKRTRTWMRP